ncbi:MAG: HlyC/CorC family transporter [Candidatus Aminicenantes bacterium]|nr:HlyC/CorC family transporter [Candidatus Aminicenantes bacterium]
MFVFYIIIFCILVLFSAFFSSAETSLLSLNKIKLNLKANKKNKKAILLTKTLGNPDEFFSTILIGNNLANIAAASISTILFTKIIIANENLVLIISTLVTTIIILIFAEIIPKSYAFRYNQRLSYSYAYPIKFFAYLFYPFVKVLSVLSALIFRKKSADADKKELTPEEIKHFLSTEIKLFRYNPETLRMLNEIIDTVVGKDIKSLMTPRLNIIALDEGANIDELKKIILEMRVSKIPIYKNNLDNITGIIYSKNLVPALLSQGLEDINFKEIAGKPIFISEYSSLNYVVKQFKKRELDFAVILDEYGTTIGILTLNDIFREILGGIRIDESPIRRIDKKNYIVKGSSPIDEVNSQLGIDLPEKKDYTTMSGMFIYHFGKIPAAKSKLLMKNCQLIVEKMGKRKIEEIRLIPGELPDEE